MSYARQAAMAGAVFLGFALNGRAQEPKKDDAPSSNAASPSDASSKSSRSVPRFTRPGTRPGSDSAPLAPPSERDGQRASAGEKNTPRDDSQRREPIPPDARVIQFSFATQPWENILEWLAELAGMSLQMEVKPTGTFSYINDPTKYTLGQAIDIINGQLISKGHILLRKGNYLKVIAFKDGVPPDLIRQLTDIEQLDTCGDSEYVTVFLPLKNVSAKTAAEEVKGFVSEVGGKIVAQESVNQLMITDLVANIRLMRNYLTRVDAVGESMKSKYRVFQLKYASAAKVEAMLRELFTLPPRQATTTQNPSRSSEREDRSERFRRMMESGGGFPFAQMFAGGGQPGGESRGGESRGDRGGDSRDRGDRGSQEARTNNVTMSVDEPHNQILVMAPPDKLAIVEEFVRQVDVPRPGDSEWTPSKTQVPTVRVIRLSDGDAQSLATALTQIYQNTPGVRFSADQSNNAVVVVASPDDQEAIKKLAEQFEEDERNSIVLPLTVLDATTVAELLTNVYASGQTDWRGRATPRPGQPRVVADHSRNQLMVRGSKKQVDDIRAMLAALGEPQLREVAGHDKLRVIPLNTANSKAIREMIEQVWPTISPNNNPIRLIDLGKKSGDGESEGPAGPRRTNSSGFERSRDDSPPPADDTNGSAVPESKRPGTPAGRPRRTAIEPRSALHFVSFTDPDEPQGGIANKTARETDDPAQDDTRQDKDRDTDRQQPGAPLVVSFGPESLVIASDDPAAVQAFMNLINSVTRGTGNGSEYTVFYLKSAEATQLQLTLNELLGISLTSSLFGGSSSQSSPLLKIVPDTRTNSLIVFGNANEVGRVEQLIRVLDRDDAPSSGALSAPRIIPVQNANATAVAKVIRDVYASRMTGAGTSGFPGGQPGMPFGGGSPFTNFGNSSSRTSSRTGPGSLSVGVDEQSNSIVIASSESVFREVSELVETLDKAASETQRTVQIVTVKNSTPTAVQDALNGLMGINSRTTSVRTGSDMYGRPMSGTYSPPFGPTSMGIMAPFGGGTPGGGYPFGGSPFFNRGGDNSFNRGRSFDGNRGGDFGREPRR